MGEGQELKDIDISKIQIGQSQPRRHFARDEIAQLAASIKAVGVIHPPVVVKLPDDQGYELIAGERRVRAAREAGLLTIRVIVRQGDPLHDAQLALIENVQRVDLNPVEIARGLKKLIDGFGLTQRELARRIGKRRSTIANYLRLLCLSENIQHSLQSGKITMGHAKAILSVTDAKQQESLHREILKGNVSVRQAEDLAKQKTTHTNNDEALHLKHLQTQIQQKLGGRVEIRGKGTQGKLILHYADLDELDRFLSVIGVE